MAFPTFKNLIVIGFLVLFLPFSVVQCTSSDDDSSVLEDELESLGDDENALIDDIDDLDGISDEDLTDVVDEGDDELAELSDEDGQEDVAEFESDEEEFEEGNDDFDGADSEFAKADDEFDEFDEIEDGDSGEGGNEFAQNEEALAQEINKQPQDYPVAQDAKPQFPEEVMGQDVQNPYPAPPGETGQPLPLAGGPLITSETQDVTDMPGPNEPMIPQDDLGMADPIVPLPDSDYPEEKSWVPVVKVRTDPFFKSSERLLNAVYIARPDESLSSISEKIYGEDRTKELNDDNPHLAKGIDPGDKIYYNSPNRSDDKSTLKIYYDDVGLAPQFYKTKKNDNMRRLGTKLIGFNEGWKEIWAINPQVDSKTILPAGMELKYWTGEETKPKLEIADSTSVADSPSDDSSTGESMEDGDDMAVGMVDQAFDDSELPPEPPLPEAQIAAPDPTLEPEAIPDIEPFPEEGVQETPGPAPVAAKPADANNSLLSIGAIALLIMAGAGLIAIQIKRRRDNTGINPASLEYTQV